VALVRAVPEGRKPAVASEPQPTRPGPARPGPARQLVPARGTHNISLAGQEKETQTS